MSKPIKLLLNGINYWIQNSKRVQKNMLIVVVYSIASCLAKFLVAELRSLCSPRYIPLALAQSMQAYPTALIIVNVSMIRTVMVVVCCCHVVMIILGSASPIWDGYVTTSMCDCLVLSNQIDYWNVPSCQEGKLPLVFRKHLEFKKSLELWETRPGAANKEKHSSCVTRLRYSSSESHFRRIRRRFRKRWSCSFQI